MFLKRKVKHRLQDQLEKLEVNTQRQEEMAKILEEVTNEERELAEMQTFFESDKSKEVDTEIQQLQEDIDKLHRELQYTRAAVNTHSGSGLFKYLIGVVLLFVIAWLSFEARIWDSGRSNELLYEIVPRGAPPFEGIGLPHGSV